SFLFAAVLLAGLALHAAANEYPSISKFLVDGSSQGAAVGNYPVESGCIVLIEMTYLTSAQISSGGEYISNFQYDTGKKTITFLTQNQSGKMQTVSIRAINGNQTAYLDLKIDPEVAGNTQS